MIVTEATPTDFRFLKDWLTAEEIEKQCVLHNISRSQAHNIFAGRSKNWKFLETMITLAQDRMNKVEKTMLMEKHLNEYKTATA